jgi:AraC-like DNA-binding protein
VLHPRLEGDLEHREGRTVDWAGLALSPGYFDQAHFIRDFTRLVGRPPGDHARREGPR